MSVAMPTGKVEFFDLFLTNAGENSYPALELVSESSAPRPALVIGDLHGHLDRFEALLKQEGLLDRCEPCGGTGMKSLDGRREEWDTDNCEKCEGDGWSRTDKPAEVILLGDIGHFGHDASPTGDMLTWLAAVRWADVILWGNHDRALVAQIHQFSGYMKPGPEVYHLIARARAEGKLKLAHVSHGWLMTHAGLHKAFRDSIVPAEVKVDPEAFAEWINTVEDPVEDPANKEEFLIGDTRYKIGARDAIGSVRGGWASYGGILWRDVREKLYAGFPQVFGHSADHGEHEVRYCWEDGNTRKYDKIPDAVDRSRLSYCVDIGGKGDKPGDNCLAGVWLPEGRVVRVDL